MVFSHNVPGEDDTTRESCLCAVKLPDAESDLYERRKGSGNTCIPPGLKLFFLLVGKKCYSLKLIKSVIESCS